MLSQKTPFSFSPNLNLALLWLYKYICSSFSTPCVLQDGEGITSILSLCVCCFQTTAFPFIGKMEGASFEVPSVWPHHSLYYFLSSSRSLSLLHWHQTLLWGIILLISQYTGITASGPLLTLFPFPGSLSTQISTWLPVNFHLLSEAFHDILFKI